MVIGHYSSLNLLLSFFVHFTLLPSMITSCLHALLIVVPLLFESTVIYAILTGFTISHHLFEVLSLAYDWSPLCLPPPLGSFVANDLPLNQIRKLT